MRRWAGRSMWMVPFPALVAPLHGAGRQEIAGNLNKAYQGSATGSRILAAAGAKTWPKPTIMRPPGSGLDDSTVRILEKWRFKPATRSGKPIALRAPVEVEFRLGEKDKRTFLH